MRQVDLIEGEEWRPVVGYEGRYEVSSQGRVRSVGREVKFGDRFRVVKPRIVRQYISENGYLCVYVSREGEYKRGWDREVVVHKLVLEAFVGARPGGCWASHLDDVKTDNRLVNLVWDTPRGNIENAVRNGRRVRGFSKPNVCKLTPSQVDEIKGRYVRGKRGTGGWKGNVLELAREFNVSESLINEVANHGYSRRKGGPERVASS